MQVANGEVPYGEFKRDFIDAGKEAETEAMKIVDRMEGGAARSSSDLNVKHMVEIEEVRSALFEVYVCLKNAPVLVHQAVDESIVTERLFYKADS